MSRAEILLYYLPITHDLDIILQSLLCHVPLFWPSPSTSGHECLALSLVTRQIISRTSYQLLADRTIGHHHYNAMKDGGKDLLFPQQLVKIASLV